MKIGCAIIAYNAATWIESVVRGLSGYADDIVVVEGAVERMAFDAPNGSSTDRTIEIIESLADKGLIYDGGSGEYWTDKIAMRQETIQILRTLECDWLHVIDADEFYMPEDLVRLRGILETASGPGFEFPLYHFWGDLGHIATGGQWDRTLPRMFRLTESLEYTSRHDLPAGVDNLPPLDIHIWHTGWLDTPEKIQGKLRYYQEREGGIHPATIVPFHGKLPLILDGVNTEGLISPPGG